MATYTTADLEAASKFANVNATIRTIQKLEESAKHLTSWLDYSIRDATHDDYYIPASLAHCCKVIDVKIPKNLCDLLSCNPLKEEDTCIPGEIASYYYVGDDGYDVQCQPSCYNTASKKTYNDDNSRAVDVPMLNFHNDKCRIMHTPMVGWLEKTFYRSDTKFEVRVNDMPTGFSRTTTDNEYGSGITYKTNATYCDYYDRHFEEDGSCQMNWLENVTDAVIGQSLINTIKSSIRVLTNNNIPFNLPQNLPPLPTELKSVHTLKGWRENINNAFVVPELIDTSPKVITTRHRRDTIYHKNTTLNDLIYSRRQAEESQTNLSDFTLRLMKRTKREADKSNASLKNKHTISGLIDSINYKQELIKQAIKQQQFASLHPEPQSSVDTCDNILPEAYIEPHKDHIALESKLNIDTYNYRHKLTKREVITPTDDPSTIDRVLKTIKDAFVAILKLATDPHLAFMLSVNYITDQILSNLKPLLLTITERITSLAYAGLEKIIGSIGDRVLIAGLRGMVIKAVGSMAINIGSKLAVLTAKLLGAAASVVGWLLAASMILDLIFGAWDPYGYNNMFPATIPNDMMQNAEMTLRQHAKAPSMNFEFQHFASTILSEEELLQIQVESLIDHLIYLDALVVNSEGSRINKGESLDVSQVNQNDYNGAAQQGAAERVKWDSHSFAKYNERFMDRVTVNRTGNMIAIILFGVSAFCLIVRLNVLAIVALILCVVLLAITHLQVYNNLFVDFVEKYTVRVDAFGASVGFSPS